MLAELILPSKTGAYNARFPACPWGLQYGTMPVTEV